MTLSTQSLALTSQAAVVWVLLLWCSRNPSVKRYSTWSTLIWLTSVQAPG